jgi:hypothetical protein
MAYRIISRRNIRKLEDLFLECYKESVLKCLAKRQAPPLLGPWGYKNIPEFRDEQMHPMSIHRIKIRLKRQGWVPVDENESCFVPKDKV